MIVEHIRGIDLYEPYVPKSPDEKHISVTSLLKPAYQVWLKIKEQPTDLVDVNMDAAILGSLVHFALEQLVSSKIAKRFEERISFVVDGVTINGQFDLVVDGHVSDYKTGKLSKLDNLESYIWQLSIYRWLIWKAFNKVLKDTGFLVFILLDFSIMHIDTPEYRKHNVTSMFHEEEVKLHSFEEVEIFIRETLTEINGDEAPDQCETWYSFKARKHLRCEFFCEYRNVCQYQKKHQEKLEDW